MSDKRDPRFTWDESDVEWNPDDGEKGEPGGPLLPPEQREKAIEDLDKGQMKVND